MVKRKETRLNEYVENFNNPNLILTIDKIIAEEVYENEF